SEEGGGGRGMKEKQHGSTSNTTKDLGHCSTSISCTAAPNEGNVLTNVIDSPDTPSNSGPKLSGPTSYALLVTSETSRKSVKFCTLVPPEGNMADVAISMESVRAINESFTNTVYGFFWGKQMAYPNVDNYDSDVNLLKEDVGIVPIWVKFHGVPMTAFSEDSLSDIATKLDTPLMLDSYTSDVFENDDDLDTNGEISKSAGKGANFGVSLSDHEFFHVSSNSTCTTIIVERIDKLERQIIDGKLTLVDDDGNLLPKVVSTAICDDFDITICDREKK
nr:hypothetical protein [Tanacetum cinerariifolium]